MKRPTYHFNGLIPRARDKRVLGHEIPANAINFSTMLFPRTHRKLRNRGIEELYRAITTSNEGMILVSL